MPEPVTLRPRGGMIIAAIHVHTPDPMCTIATYAITAIVVGMHVGVAGAFARAFPMSMWHWAALAAPRAALGVSWAALGKLWARPGRFWASPGRFWVTIAQRTRKQLS